MFLTDRVSGLGLAIINAIYTVHQPSKLIFLLNVNQKFHFPLTMLAVDQSSLSVCPMSYSKASKSRHIILMSLTFALSGALLIVH